MRKPSNNPDFRGIRGPSAEDLAAIELNVKPDDIPGVPAGKAVTSMCTEYAVGDLPPLDVYTADIIG